MGGTLTIGDPGDDVPRDDEDHLHQAGLYEQQARALTGAGWDEFAQDHSSVHHHHHHQGHNGRAQHYMPPAYVEPTPPTVPVVWQQSYPAPASPQASAYPAIPASTPGSWPSAAANSITTANDPWVGLPLHQAAATGAPSAELNRLVAHEGQDVDAQDASGATPLHLACYYGHEHCVLWLMNRGRARFIVDADGNTPADVARQNGHIKLAEALEERMGEAAKTNRWRRTGGAGQERREEQLFVEVSRLQSENSRLRASEKRARLELEAEVAERVKLFRRLVGPGHETSNISSLDIIADLRLQAASYKAQRDALHAELRLVEETLKDLETLLNGAPSAGSAANPEEITSESYISPSARLKACLRRI